MNYVIRTTETYRVPNEEAVKKLLEELKSNRMFEIVKYSSIKKERKEKGEIVDEWIRLEVVKVFNDEKEPISEVQVRYDKGDFEDGN